MLLLQSCENNNNRTHQRQILLLISIKDFYRLIGIFIRCTGWLKKNIWPFELWIYILECEHKKSSVAVWFCNGINNTLMCTKSTDELFKLWKKIWCNRPCIMFFLSLWLTEKPKWVFKITLLSFFIPQYTQKINIWMTIVLHENDWC